jgi:hypothetical protein
MARSRMQICQELTEALAIWDKMNNDLAAMRGHITQEQHTIQRMKIDSLVHELEACKEGETL